MAIDSLLFTDDAGGMEAPFRLARGSWTNGQARHIGLLLHDFRLGGSERIAIRLAREWAARGRRVTLFVGEGSGHLSRLVSPLVSICFYDQKYERSKWQIRRLARWAAQAATAAGVDVMFLPGNSYFRAIPALSSKLPVLSKLSNPIVRRDKNPLRNFTFRMATARRWRTLDGLVICSQGQADEIHEQVQPQVPVTVITNPILDAMPSGIAAKKVPGQFCAVGRLELQKNYPLLLRAFALLGDLPLTLRIAGDGNLRDELQRLAEELGLEHRVQFLLTVDNVAPLMAQSEALLLSSDYEASSAVCVEAMAAGTFVIARDCGAGVREILAVPRTGRIVASHTPQAFAAAIREYWTTRQGDAVAARAAASNYVIGPIAERYLQLLDKAAVTRSRE
ncbi:MAG: glycosyltransferase [Pseudomonadota bacterium]